MLRMNSYESSLYDSSSSSSTMSSDATDTTNEIQVNKQDTQQRRRRRISTSSLCKQSVTVCSMQSAILIPGEQIRKVFTVPLGAKSIEIRVKNNATTDRYSFSLVSVQRVPRDECAARSVRNLDITETLAACESKTFQMETVTIQAGASSDERYVIEITFAKSQTSLASASVDFSVKFVGFIMDLDVHDGDDEEEDDDEENELLLNAAAPMEGFVEYETKNQQLRMRNRPTMMSSHLDLRSPMMMSLHRKPLSSARQNVGKEGGLFKSRSMDRIAGAMEVIGFKMRTRFAKPRRRTQIVRLLE